ncbi:hypothetical protein [Streptomyces sp. NPDC086010]|uniref:hypothetical protein n=1 Tax=Streptomyces sp. NPDC086010 TaxID=3365745 RepID=UPI0037D0641F
MRAGRHLVRTLADLAAQQGVSPQRYAKLKPYAAPGFPAPVSAAGARTRLYDGEQIDAHLMGKPISELPDQDDDADLLDRQECAAELGVSPRTWDGYNKAPLLSEHVTEAGGGSIGPGASCGSTRTVGRARPRSPAGRRTQETRLTPDQAAVALGYPTAQVRRATVRAQAVLRARRAAPYLADVAQALHRHGWTTTATALTVHHPADDVVAAALVLDGDNPPALAPCETSGTDGAPPPPDVTPSPRVRVVRPKVTASATPPPALHLRRMP